MGTKKAKSKAVAPEGEKAPPVVDLYKPPTTFREFAKHFRKLLPFIWPRGKHSLKFRGLLFLCFLSLLAGRGMNLLLPLQYKKVVDGLGGLAGIRASPEDIPYLDLLLFVALRFLSAGGGFLSTVQGYLWIPVGQYTTRTISVGMFQHLHNLSLRFHLNRKDRGVASIVSLFSSIIFNIIPTLCDIAIACFYFAIKFDFTFGLIVFATMGLYIYSTIHVTENRTKYRRVSNTLNNAMEARAVDSLLNFETVKYYNAEEFEVRQFKTAVKQYQRADLKANAILYTLNTAQNIIIQTGLLIGCILCAKRIVHDKTMTVGDFVLYLTYITQLYGPLNRFGNQYRTTQKNFIDMEKMLDLFGEPIEVLEAVEPVDLKHQGGKVVFENVSFSYDSRPILEGISFSAAGGSTIALVGPSGSGKSTVLRLLFRFYDCQRGRITVDGVDIRDLRLKDLRGIIGVVPQDTVLFNDTIMYNIKYGRPSATDEEVFAAANAAQIHDRILSFPDGYDTKVGERGLRLSGGEKQRVAIARTFVKNCQIILMDEATSALDTQAEAALQSALLTRSHTTIVIAHRLSTIVHADQILVIKDGRCVERGTHESLMRMRESGTYFDMWMKQLKDEMGLGGLAKMESVGRWVKGIPDSSGPEGISGMRLDREEASAHQPSVQQQAAEEQVRQKADGDGDDMPTAERPPTADVCESESASSGSGSEEPLLGAPLPEEDLLDDTVSLTESAPSVIIRAPRSRPSGASLLLPPRAHTHDHEVSRSESVDEGGSVDAVAGTSLGGDGSAVEAEGGETEGARRRKKKRSRKTK